MALMKRRKKEARLRDQAMVLSFYNTSTQRESSRSVGFSLKLDVTEHSKGWRIDAMLVSNQ